MIISSAQCRAARALLDWTQDTLAENAQVARATVADFESTTRLQPMRQNAVAIASALEAAGVEFISDDDAESGPGVGVRFRKVEIEYSKTVKPHGDDVAIKVRYRDVIYTAIISREVIDDLDRTNYGKFEARALSVQKHFTIFLRAIENKLIAGSVTPDNRVIIDTHSLPDGAL